jgi:glycosyltransferase involved in cell wall biosynthesis
MAPLRILAVISSSEIGGAERVFATTIAGLDPARFEVEVVCDGRGPAVEAYRRRGTKVRCEDLANVLDPRAVARLWSVMRRTRPDVVHTHLWNADVLAGAAARLARVPVLVSTIHGAYYVPVDERGTIRIRREALSGLYRGVYRAFDRIIAVSRYVADDLVHRRGIHVGPEKITVIYNGVDLAAIEEVARRAAGEIGPGASPSRPRIISVANFVPMKGQEQLLRALPKVIREFPGAHCVLVGDGPGRGASEALARRLGVLDHVTFMGTVVDPLPRVLDSDVFVLPSLTAEGSPIALLEALALGKAVVATHAGGTPEIVENGRTGVVVPPQDVPALAEGIVRILGDPSLARRLGAAGREAIVTRFAAASMVERLADLYTDLLRSKRGEGGGGLTAPRRAASRRQF